MERIRSLSVLFNIQPGERLQTLLLFAWLFLFICVYYVLRPIRRGLVLEGLGNENMPFVYLGTAIVTGAVVWLYSKFTHLPRRHLIGSIYGIFIVNLLFWWQAFAYENAWLSGLFWIWLDVFSIMGVTLFWMYANDLFDPESATRLFGVIVAGGGLGAILGSSITAGLVEQVGSVNMILVAAGIVAVTLITFLFLESIAAQLPPRRRRFAGKERQQMTSGMASIMVTIVKSRFLRFLLLLVCFERMVPDLVQFLYNDILAGLAGGQDTIAALDANLERWRAIFEFIVEILLVSAILRRFGTACAFSSAAVVILVGLTIFSLFPVPFVVLAVFHSDEAIRHSWFKAAKELTYTATESDVLYNVKPVIEMFFYRFARGIAGLALYLVNTVMGFGTVGVIFLAVVAAVAWAFVGVRLSREYLKLACSTGGPKVTPQTLCPTGERAVV